MSADLLSLADRCEAMLETAGELRANANGDCSAIMQAIHWEARAAALRAHADGETGRG